MASPSPSAGDSPKMELVPPSRVQPRRRNWKKPADSHPAQPVPRTQLSPEGCATSTQAQLKDSLTNSSSKISTVKGEGLTHPTASPAPKSISDSGNAAHHQRGGRKGQRAGRRLRVDLAAPDVTSDGTNDPPIVDSPSTSYSLATPKSESGFIPPHLRKGRVHKKESSQSDVATTNDSGLSAPPNSGGGAAARKSQPPQMGSSDTSNSPTNSYEPCPRKAGDSQAGPDHQPRASTSTIEIGMNQLQISEPKKTSTPKSAWSYQPTYRGPESSRAPKVTLQPMTRKNIESLQQARMNQRQSSQTGASRPAATGPWQQVDRYLPQPRPSQISSAPQRQSFHNVPPITFQQATRINTQAVINASSLKQSAGQLLMTVQEEFGRIAMDESEIVEKLSFQRDLVQVVRSALATVRQATPKTKPMNEERANLHCFGSTGSGFATKGADMDLAFSSPLYHPDAGKAGSPIPAVLEHAFLDAGYGVRLLLNTRVPILKICQKPTPELLEDLRKLREPDAVSEESSGPEVKEQAFMVAASLSGQTIRPSIDPKTGKYNDFDPALAQAWTKIDELLKLKQEPQESLTEYYRRTRHLLHKIGGRDWTWARPDYPDDSQCMILTATTRQFVKGMHEGPTKSALSRCNLISIDEDDGDPKSLQVAFSYAEIDHLIEAFWSRRIVDADQKQELNCKETLHQWNEFTREPNLDTPSLTKYMDKVCNTLNALPSVQVQMLRQKSTEDAKRYATRAHSIFCRTIGVSPFDRSGRVEREFGGDGIHYIDLFMRGIISPTIRAKTVARTPKQGWRSLNELYTHYSAVARIESYQLALQSGFYTGQALEAVQSKIQEIENNYNYFSPSTVNRLLDMLKEYPHPDCALLSPSENGSNTSMRPRYGRGLEFPTSGVGIQCDINFSNELAIHNTELLRCYSLCDPRVRPFVIFVKSWTKARNINTPYHGTLSSYGYVLMCLHYLINVAKPPVLVNLQHLHAERQVPANSELDRCGEYDIRFFRDADRLQEMAKRGEITKNTQDLGELVMGFFQYFAGVRLSNEQVFDWGGSVLSLRSKGGLLTKRAKEWNVAKSTFIEVPITPDRAEHHREQPKSEPAPEIKVEEPVEKAVSKGPTPGEIPASPPAQSTLSLIKAGETPVDPIPLAPGAYAINHLTGVATQIPDQSRNRSPAEEPPKTIKKEIRHRYLIAIEDPFETEHNVGRTVAHHGIVAIRDEFRRAWRIVSQLGVAGRNGVGREGLLDRVAQLE